MTGICIAWLVLGAATTEPEATSVAVYLPSIFFAGAEEKAIFLSAVETAIGEKLGAPVMASFSADPQKLRTQPLWIVDAGLASLAEPLLVLQQAATTSGASRPVSLFSTSSGRNAFELLARGTIAIPDAGGVERAVLRYWLLLDEPGAEGIAKRVKTVRDARAALSAAAAGEIDGALVYQADYGRFDPRLADAEEISWLQELPLPVFGINRAVVGSAAAERMTDLLQSVRLPPVPGIIQSWTPTRGGNLALLARSLRQRASPVSRDLVLASLPAFGTFLGSELPPPPGPPPLPASIVMPGGRYPDLPDPARQTVP